MIPKVPRSPGDPAGMRLHKIVTCSDEFWGYCSNVAAGVHYIYTPLNFESGPREKSLGTYDADEAAVCLTMMNVRLDKYSVNSRTRCICAMYNNDQLSICIGINWFKF